MESSRIQAQRWRPAREMVADLPPEIHQLLDLYPGWFWTTDAEHRFTWFSDGFETYTGEDPGKLIGLTRPDLFREEGLRSGALERHRADLDARRAFANFVYRAQFRHIGVAWVCTSGMPSWDDDGRFRGYRGIGLPISEAMIEKELSVRAEQDLMALTVDLEEAVEARNAEVERTDALLREVIEGVDQGLLVSTASPREGGTVVLTNSRFAELTETDPALCRAGASMAALSDHFKERGLLGPDRAQCEAFQDRALAGEPMVLHPDAGLARRLLLRRKTLPDGGAIATFTDVTTLEDRAAELDRARDAAEDANRAKTAFLSAMAHEFRTPLNGMTGACDILAEMDLPAEARDYVDVLLRSVDAFGTVLDDVLTYAGSESGAAEDVHASFHVADVLEDVASLFVPSFAQRGIAFSVRAGSGLGALRAGAPSQLRRVLVHLLGNAEKFTSAGFVRVAAVGRADGIAIRVRDSGTGIPPDAQERIWRAFEQVDQNLTRGADGAGLGLAITRQAIERCGGRIGVDSAPGAGTAFTFFLPMPAGLAPAEAGRPRLGAGADVPAGTARSDLPAAARRAPTSDVDRGAAPA